MASTFVNNLRLTEMATGENTSTWGDVTNVNLEMIGQALAYGVENLAANADATITMADGALDTVRSMYLKLTSTTLNATRTVTLAPNTVSKMWMIENATTGGQSIIIKQGSGATVTIANGKTSVVYTDGAGSGAKVVDAYNSLSVGGLTVGDNKKILLGSDDDAEIYHDGSNMYFKNDTGNTLAYSDTFQFFSHTGSELFAQLNHNSAVKLYFDSAQKFETTAAGANVSNSANDVILKITTTGTNKAANLELNNTVAGYNFIKSDTNGTVDWRLGGGAAAGTLTFQTGSSNAERMRISSAGLVGISTAAPQGRLDILGNSDSVIAFRIGANADFGWNFYDSSTNGDLIVKSEQSGTQTETFRLPRAGGAVVNGASNQTIRLQNSSNNSRISFVDSGTSADTTLFGSNAGGFQWYTASNLKMSLLSAGNLGIGISPAARLHIKQAANSTNNGFRTERSDTTGHGVIYMGGDDDLYIQNQANGDINWYTNAAQKMTLKADGKLGIGTGVPTAGFDLRAGLNGHSQFAINASTTAGGGAGGAFLKFHGSNAAAAPQIAGIDGSMTNGTDGSESGILSFYTTNSGTSGEKIRILSDGKVGIGLAGPTDNLQVTGSGRQAIGVSSTGSGAAVLELMSSGSTEVISYGNDLRFAKITGLGDAGFSEKMRILAGGNVAIGSASASGKLHVTKSSTVEAVLGTATNGHLFESQSDDNTDGFEIYQQHGSNTTRESFVVNDNRTGSKSTAFSIRGDGRVLINPVTGFRTPTGSLLVQTTLANTANVFYMFKVAQVEMTMGFKASTDTNFYVGTGSQTIGTGGVYLTNTATQWTHNSDFRVKKNLVPIENALDKIANCRAMTGHYKREDDDVKRRPFLIAQDWVTALPEAVDEDTVDDDGVENLGLSYEGTVPLLVAAIKELREQNIALTNRITSLEG